MMVVRGDWMYGLEVWLPGQAHPVDVKSTNEASALLAERWPVTFGPAFEYALATCAAVTEGQLPAEEARQALVEAAIAAGIVCTQRVQGAPAAPRL
ncbi:MULTISPECIES: DUF982 domain-containing protein [Rhizobium]|nr:MULTISPECIES: DUF982 domain-containing protein [Rhizobium]MCS0463127.1 DUF982 domain-containing protein [Rhizobium favelukesii]UFS85171.1 DUF982 domain-containing protein [Rhizobium sp. T136]